MENSEMEQRKSSVTSGHLLEGDSTNSERKMSRRDIKKTLFVCSFAFMMNYAAYGGLVFLQSSMNIEDGLGTASLFAIYATSSLSTILFVPFFIDFMGAKTAIVLGELGVLSFTIANIYPCWYTMMPVAIFHGLTESASWSGVAVYVTYLGEQYWDRKRRMSRHSKSKHNEEHYIYRFLSIFFVFVYLAQVIGNAVVCLVLSSLKGTTLNPLYYNSSVAHSSGNITLFDNVTTSNTKLVNNESWSNCGATECQSEYIYDGGSEKLQKFEPNQTAVYLLLGVFLLLQITFTSVHACFIPKIPAKFDTIKDEEKLVETKRSDRESMIKAFHGTSRRFKNVVRSELKETCFHLVSPQHALVFPMLFYGGVLIAFNVTEFTRAYVSCTIGVEQVGLVIVVYGFSSMMTSLLCTKMIPYLGRNIVLAIVTIVHFSSFWLCLMWQPSFGSWWMVYLISACLGCCDGSFTNVVQGMIAIYFQDKLGIAFSVKNFDTNLGIVVGTGISTSLCIYVKIYILMILLFISIFGYVLAEIFYRRSKHPISNYKS